MFDVNVWIPGGSGDSSGIFCVFTDVCLGELDVFIDKDFIFDWAEMVMMVGEGQNG